MSFQSNTINVNEAAKLLRVDKTKVKRYVKSGLLKAKKKSYLGRNYLFYAIDKKDVSFLRDSFKNYNQIEDIKKLFVLNEELRQKHGSLDDIVKEFGHDKNMLQSAATLYSFKRKNYFNQFHVRPEKFFLSEEIAERLTITHPQAIYDLRDMKELKCKKLKDSRQGKRYFIEKDSFFDYLGKDKGVIFYNSRYAADEMGETVERIDRIALISEIGRKLKPGYKNSIYLFSLSDICRMKRLNKVIPTYNRNCYNKLHPAE